MICRDRVANTKRYEWQSLHFYTSVTVKKQRGGNGRVHRVPLKQPSLEMKPNSRFASQNLSSAGHQVRVVCPPSAHCSTKEEGRWAKHQKFLLRIRKHFLTDKNNEFQVVLAVSVVGELCYLDPYSVQLNKACLLMLKFEFGKDERREMVAFFVPAQVLILSFSP